MSIVASVLENTQYLPTTTASDLFTATKVTRITAITIRNSGAGANLVELYIVPSGQSVGAEYKLFSESLATGVTDLGDELVGHNLAIGDAIYGTGATASEVIIRISGVEG